MVAKKNLQDKPLITYNFENQVQFSSLIRKALGQVGDLKEAFFLISEDFYKSERAIFKLKSKGGYVDLSPKYKTLKTRILGDPYPILKFSGALEKSITTPNAEGSIRRISKTDLIIGTSIPYGVFHNSDATRNKIPQRKFVFIGPEVRWFNQRDRQKGGGRLTRWSAIIEKTTEQKLKRLGF